jgi:hypothetical protein
MKSRLIFGFIGCLLMTISTPSVLLAQQKDYGTNRQLRTCPSRTEPTRGRITVEQAKRYVACSFEEKPPFNGSIKFVDVLSLEIAPKTRSAKPADFRLSNLDPTKPIYELRGSIVIYSCANVAGRSTPPPGQNCSISRDPKAEGKCYQTPFNEWHCVMRGAGLLKRPEHKMPPPQ